MSLEKAIIGHMNEGILAFDPSGQIYFCNPACKRLLGIELETETNALYAHLPKQIFTIMQELQHAQQIAPRDLVHNEKILQCYGTTLNYDRADTSFLVVINDVTEIRRLELVRSDFIANVSHELRTPIASVKGSLETLLDITKSHSSDIKRFLAIAHRNSERLGEIVEDLLMLSRLEADEINHMSLPSVDLYAIAHSARDLCITNAEQRSIKLELYILSEQSLEISGHANLLEQAIVNLIDNAIKHSEQGDTVTVQLEPHRHTTKIIVRDFGCGIPEEKLTRIFERFYRIDTSRSRSSGGSGLGLAIVKHIVHLHRGKVYATSVVGEGSVFTIELPHNITTATLGAREPEQSRL